MISLPPYLVNRGIGSLEFPELFIRLGNPKERILDKKAAGVNKSESADPQHFHGARRSKNKNHYAGSPVEAARWPAERRVSLQPGRSLGDIPNSFQDPSSWNLQESGISKIVSSLLFEVKAEFENLLVVFPT